MLNSSNRYWQIISITLTCLFPCLIMYLILNNWVNVPSWDDMDDTVPIASHFLSHQINFNTFWHIHVSHRIVWTRLIDLSTYIFFSGNRLPLLLLQWLIQLAIFTLLVWQLRKRLDFKNQYYWLLLPIFSALLFAPQMGLIWLWGFILQQTLTPFFFALAVFSLSYDTKFKPHILTLALAVICTLTSGNGLLIWPVLVGLLIVGRSDWRLIIGYSILGAIIIALYKYGMPVSLTQALAVTWIYRIAYFLSFIGAIFSKQNIKIACLMGFGGILVYFFLGCQLFSKKFTLAERRQLLPWLALGLLTIGSAVLGSIGRIEAGPVQAMSDRYIPLSAPFWLAILVVLLIYLEKIDLRKFKKILVISGLIFTLLVMGLYVKTAKVMWSAALSYQSVVRLAVFALQYNVYIVNPETQFGLLYPRYDIALQSLSFLKDHQFAFYNRGLEKLEVNQKSWLIAKQPIQGDFETLNLQNSDYDTCHYGFMQGFYAAGHIDNQDKREATIYLLDKAGTLYGSGYTTAWHAAKGQLDWVGFVNASQAYKKVAPVSIIAYAKYPNSDELYRIPGVKVLPNGTGCMLKTGANR